MRKGHPAERQPFMGRPAYFIGQTEGPADKESNVAPAGYGQRLKCGRQLFGGKLPAGDIEDDELRVGTDRLQQALAFFGEGFAFLEG